MLNVKLYLYNLCKFINYTENILKHWLNSVYSIEF